MRRATITMSLLLGAPFMGLGPGAASASEAWVAVVPAAVSPGDPSTAAPVEDRCPTFSWGEVEGARGYEVVVYHLGKEDEDAEPVVREIVAGSAALWTPSLEGCLERGERYAWSIRAVLEGGPSDWSTPSLFEIAAGPSRAELETALAVVRGHVEEQARIGAGERRQVQASTPVAPDIGGQDVATAGAREKEAGSPIPAIAGPVSDAAVLPVGDLDCRGGRYEDNGDGTVSDCRTGLVWLKNTSCFATEWWSQAQLLVAGLFDGSTNDPAGGDCGLSDGSAAGFWRLPTINECREMLASAVSQGLTDPALTDAQGTSRWSTDGDAFVGVATSGIYWSEAEVSASQAWSATLSTGIISARLKDLPAGVWPVRAGE